MSSCCATVPRESDDDIHQFVRLEFEYLRSRKLRSSWRGDKVGWLALIREYLSRDECFGSDLVFYTLAAHYARYDLIGGGIATTRWAADNHPSCDVALAHRPIQYLSALVVRPLLRI